MGGRYLALDLLRHVVCDREDAAWHVSARRDRESDARPRFRHQRTTPGDLSLRRRRRARRPCRRARRADLSGQSADGRQHHHHRLRRRRDRRARLGPRLDRHRHGAGHPRRPLEGVLSRSFEHGDLRHHDSGADDPTGRPLWDRALMAEDVGHIAAVAKQARITRDNLVWMALGIVILAVAPFLVYPVFLIKLLCMALFACAFNLLIGGGGLLSFGHAAFFGSAAYIAAHTAKVWGFPFEAAILAGTLVAAALGYVFGLIAIRRQGLYFAMITLALAQAIYFLALRLPFTHSEDGIQAVPRGWLFGVKGRRKART